MKILDLFCGLGGWSKAFAEAGHDCTGVDIVNLGYPYRFIKADLNDWVPDQHYDVKPNDIIKYNRHKDGKAAYLWSNIGKVGFLCSTINMKVNTSKIKKIKSTLHKKSERALIPYPISKAVLTKIEND